MTFGCRDAYMPFIKMFRLSYLKYLHVSNSLLKNRKMCSISFVPKFEPVCETDCEKLKKFLFDHDKITVITGAGISTESGIPDYRSEEVGLYARSNHKPVQYIEFLKSSYIRQRYWARNFIGWPRFSQIQPNVSHHILCDLERMEKISCIITQNVDNLHFKAGSTNVIELHGTAFTVICLSCNNKITRHEFQSVLSQLNPDMQSSTTMIRPDGDVEISEDQIKDFKVPTCLKCQGILKPDITFFGDNVPKARVQRVQKEVNMSNALLVLGSSLSTFSGYRIVLQAKEENKKVAIVNIGKTRADKEADLKISTKCGDLLTKKMEAQSEVMKKSGNTEVEECIFMWFIQRQ